MKHWIRKRTLGIWLAVCTALLCICFPVLAKMQNAWGMYALNTVQAAAEETDDVIYVESIDVHMTVREDRKLNVCERFTVRFLENKTMFYRSLPMQGARYEDITAKCEGNDEFSFYVEDNPDVDGFIDICCVGNADAGKTWTYELTYVMEQAVSKPKNGMIIDVVGYGATVQMRNVTAVVEFPEAPISYQIYTDAFGSTSGNVVTQSWSDDGKVLTMHANLLDFVYNEEYNEVTAGGITVEFVLSEGALKGYAYTRIHTGDVWKFILAGAIGIALAVVLLIFTKHKRDVVTVVNVKPPQGMDPMKMGKWIDGVVNNEDVTSMIYYFAEKGYLEIDFTDEEDPELISLVNALPSDAPIYEKTLFNGLFERARVVDAEQPFEEVQPKLKKAVKVSELEGKFFEASQTAMGQVPDAPTMYEMKSIFGYLGGALIGLLIGFLLPLFMSFRLGGGYGYFLGIIFLVPLALILAFGYLGENHRYKWKTWQRWLLMGAGVLVALAFTALYVFAIAQYVMTEFEKLLLCVAVFAPCFITQSALSRTEEYLATLRDILGFKQFIVVTEEDKIKVMLEENPQLYYKVLPYAQVLGVTSEWEDKFKNLTIEPPTWCAGTYMTSFDYYLLHRSMNRAMLASMARAAQAAQGGSRIGRSGGGGSFGSFGGGGFGGGGFGAR